MVNIRQNVFFAFIDNVLGVPIAAGVLYPFVGLLLSPMMAGAALTFSSVSGLGMRHGCDDHAVKAESPEYLYTRRVGWTQRTISLILLAVLAGLPVSGSVCAVLCARAANAASSHEAAAAHHTSAASCHESATAEQPELVAAVGHDCGSHDGTLREAAESIAAARADVNVVSVSQGLAPAPDLLSLTSLHADWGDSPPSATASSSRIPVVLRI